MGMTVPAAEASLSIYTRIITRLGSDDDLESNASTFMVEMREAAIITRYMDKDTLILVDELGRGTSTICGIALSTAISESLIESDVSSLMLEEDHWSL